MQSIVSESSPKQTFPEEAGAGLSQARVRVLFPLLQVSLQLEKLVHSPQLPSLKKSGFINSLDEAIHFRIKKDTGF